MIKLIVRGLTLHVICAYAPQVGLHEEAKKLLSEDLDEVVKVISNTEKIVLPARFRSFKYFMKIKQFIYTKKLYMYSLRLKKNDLV